MQLQVIRNLELTIENIHIVYEDRSTKPNHPFALGITLNYIKLHVRNLFDSTENFRYCFMFFSRQQIQNGNKQFCKKIHN